MTGHHGHRQAVIGGQSIICPIVLTTY